MKIIFLAAIIIITCTTVLNAQHEDPRLPDFGKITIADLQEKNNASFPDAAAVNLLKYMEVELSVFPNGNTEVVTITRYRTKIFNRNGYANASIIIPFYSDNTVKIKNIQAATYNIGGNGAVKITPVKEEDIFKDEGKKKDVQKSIKFTFPDIQEGSIIEYQITRKYKMAYDVPSWYFQDDIPNVFTLYKIYRPVTAQLQKRVVADLPVEETHEIYTTINTDKKQIEDVYIMKNVPAFKRETFMSSSRDYKFRMDFLVDGVGLYQPLNIWASANSWLLRSSYFGGVFDSSIPGTSSFIDSVKRLNNVPDKIRSVYNYVKKKVQWIHVYYKYARDLDEVWKEGAGTSAEINLSILNLLRKCDVQCFPVLYSTRTNGKVDYTFPDLSQFNTVNIAVVNGKKFDLLDGTNPYLSYETPPFNVVNRTGMLIDPLNHTKIDIDFDRKLIWDSIFVAATVSSAGILKGSVEKKYFDLAKSMKLENATENGSDNDDEKRNLSQLESAIKADTSWQTNTDKELLPLIEYSTFHYDLPATNDFYFLDPFLFSDFSKNPFKDSSRISDIDFGASTSSVVQMKIALAKNVRLEELPKGREIYSSDSAIVFMYQNELKNDTVSIGYSLEIKKPIFNKKEYDGLKKVFDRIYSVLNNQVLFRKKEE